MRFSPRRWRHHPGDSDRVCRRFRTRPYAGSELAHAAGLDVWDMARLHEQMENEAVRERELVEQLD